MGSIHASTVSETVQGSVQRDTCGCGSSCAPQPAAPSLVGRKKKSLSVVVTNFKICRPRPTNRLQYISRVKIFFLKYQAQRSESRRLEVGSFLRTACNGEMVKEVVKLKLMFGLLINYLIKSI